MSTNLNARRSGGSSLRWTLGSLCLLLLTALGHGSKLLAQEEAKPAEDSSGGSKITINGYLTQAYGQSDGHQIFGITKQGTADYSTAALRIRADMTPDDAFVVQFAHIRIGKSNLQQLKNDVDIEWLYYQRTWGDNRVKVGRVQIPFGIYNEVRDLGTVLPFYRPSHNFYGDAAFGSETLEGVVLTRHQDLGHGWGLSGDLHYGNWKFGNSDFAGNFFYNRADRSKGVELWVDTPITGLRVGGGAMRYDIHSGRPDVPIIGTNVWQASHYSLQGEFDRFNVHAEVKEVNLGLGIRAQLGYAQAGFRLTDKMTLNAQRDLFYIKSANVPRLLGDDDKALGLNYALRPNLILKGEHHWNRGGFWLEDVPFFGATQTPKTKYWLVSLSTAF